MYVFPHRSTLHANSCAGRRTTVVLNFLGTFEAGTSPLRGHRLFWYADIRPQSRTSRKNATRTWYFVSVSYATRDGVDGGLVQFSSVLMSMLGSTIPVSIIGARYAMAVDPFWTPEQYSAPIVSYIQ